jgi:hypothetical protein
MISQRAYMAFLTSNHNYQVYYIPNTRMTYSQRTPTDMCGG